MRKAYEMQQSYYMGGAQDQQSSYSNLTPEKSPSSYSGHKIPQNVPTYDHIPTQHSHDREHKPDFGFLQNPAMANMAMQYGSNMVGQGTYYMQNQNWAVSFDQSGPVPPRDDINALDLYIPLMAFVTYVLTSGIILGMQDRFSPEHLGVASSQVLCWLILEILMLSFTLYLMRIQTSLSYFDLIAYSGYKFVSMILILIFSMVLSTSGYYFGLVWASLALAFFLIRSLKMQVLSQAEAYPSEGNKRRLYLLVIALVQPVIMWWLTSGIVFTKATHTTA